MQQQQKPQLQQHLFIMPKKTNERQKWQKERKTLSNEKKGVRKGAASYFKVGPHRDVRSGDNALVCTHSTHTAGKVLELVDT